MIFQSVPDCVSTLPPPYLCHISNRHSPQLVSHLALAAEVILRHSTAKKSPSVQATEFFVFCNRKCCSSLPPSSIMRVAVRSAFLWKLSWYLLSKLIMGPRPCTTPCLVSSIARRSALSREAVVDRSNTSQAMFRLSRLGLAHSMSTSSRSILCPCSPGGSFYANRQTDLRAFGQ